MKKRNSRNTSLTLDDTLAETAGPGKASSARDRTSRHNPDMLVQKARGGATAGARGEERRQRSIEASDSSRSREDTSDKAWMMKISVARSLWTEGTEEEIKMDLLSLKSTNLSRAERSDHSEHEKSGV
ncbi:hypothetical protein ROHU_018239 [Labeo rohita]|uniref:Uncharacterized protein n=1 Tax=Labeo rohita TaxID=84645 RepID=A0A498NB32_LABRO|nr:hypothetical protein ROHU_018239 [Labeo rohita]